MIKYLRETLISLKNTYYLLFAKPKRQELKINIPYFSQWESPELVEKIILGDILEAAKDPKWKNSGAINKQEYLLWSWNMCGMACLKMVLSFKKLSSPPLIILGKLALKYGCYKINSASKHPATYLDGLYYYPFIKFLRKEFDISAGVSRTLVIPEIIREVDCGHLIIVSVSPQIRSSKKALNKGGHLVVITGYSLKQKCLWLNNPSGFYGQSQENFKVTFADFSKYFSNRGIIFN